MVIITGKYFPLCDILSLCRPTMTQGEKPPNLQEEKWAVAIRALKRLIPDAQAKRLLAKKKLAQIVANAIEESSLPQLHTLRALRSLLLRLSRCPPIPTGETGGPTLNTRRNPMYQELRIKLTPNVPLDGKAVQVTEGIREMCKLLNLKVIPARDCAWEDGRLKFQIDRVIGDRWATISFGIEEEP
jgi:hypothetical protein